MAITSSDGPAGEIRRYNELGLRESFSRSPLYADACRELSCIIRNGYSQLSKSVQSLIYHDTLFAFTVLRGVHTHSAISAARNLIQSAESAFPKQKRAQAVKDYKNAVVSCKRISSKQNLEYGANIMPQDVLVHIFGFLDLRSVISASEVCRAWNVAASDNQLWKSLHDSYFSALELTQAFKNCGLEERDHGDQWRLKFQQAYTDMFARKRRSNRGYCGTCSSIVWLDAVICSNASVGGKHRITHISTQQVVTYILEGVILEPSSDSESDAEDGCVFKLWAFPSRLDCV